MRRWILGAVLAVVPIVAGAQSIAVPAEVTPLARIQALLSIQAYDCSDRSCKALRSCDEACYKLMVCGQRKRDGDNDGIPCENLCRRRC